MELHEQRSAWLVWVRIPSVKGHNWLLALILRLSFFYLLFLSFLAYLVTWCQQQNFCIGKFRLNMIVMNCDCGNKWSEALTIFKNSRLYRHFSGSIKENREKLCVGGLWNSWSTVYDVWLKQRRSNKACEECTLSYECCWSGYWQCVDYVDIIVSEKVSIIRAHVTLTVIFGLLKDKKGYRSVKTFHLWAWNWRASKWHFEYTPMTSQPGTGEKMGR